MEPTTIDCVKSITNGNSYTASDLFILAQKKEKEIADQKEKDTNILLNNTIVVQLPKLYKTLFAAANEGKYCAEHIVSVEPYIVNKFGKIIVDHLYDRGFSCYYRIIPSQGEGTVMFSIDWKIQSGQ